MAISATPFLQGIQGPGFVGGFKAGQEIMDRWTRAKWEQAQRKEIENAKNLYKDIVASHQEQSINYDSAMKPFLVNHPEVLKKMVPQYIENGQLNKRGLMEELTRYNPELAKDAIEAATMPVNFQAINEQFREQTTPDVYRSIIGEQQPKQREWTGIGKDRIYNTITGEIKDVSGDTGAETGAKIINPEISNRLHLVDDQTGYDALKTQATQGGFDVSAWPVEYSEESKNKLLLAAIGDPEKALKIVKGQEQVDLQNERNKLTAERQAATEKYRQEQLDLQIKKIDDMMQRQEKREEEREQRLDFMKNKNLQAMPKLLQEAHTGEQLLSQQGAKNVMDVSTEAPPLMQQIDKLKNLIGVHGLEKMPGPIKADMESTLKLIQILMKGDSFARLGVLNGPDLEFLEDITSDPTSFYNLEPKSVLQRLENTNNFARNKFKSILNFNGFKGVEPSEFFVKEEGAETEVNNGSRVSPERRKQLQKKYGY